MAIGSRLEVQHVIGIVGAESQYFYQDLIVEFELMRVERGTITFIAHTSNAGDMQLTRVMLDVVMVIII